MVDLGEYLLGAAQVVALVAALGFAAHRLRARLLPEWGGAPARLVEAVCAVALLTWLVQLLGLLGLLYAGALLAASALLALAAALVPALRPPPPAGAGRGDGPAGPGRWEWAAAVAIVAVVVGHWAVTAKHAADRGIFNFDSLWYHLPFAAEMAKSHSLTALHHPETVFANWFYPQGSELLHAVGMLLTGRDTLSLFINFGWLALAFLAAWCIGRPWGRGPLSLVAAAVVLDCHTLVVRDPGAAKNDLAAGALLLAAIAILISAHASRRPSSPAPAAADDTGANAVLSGMRKEVRSRREGGAAWDPWALAAAGLAAGLAAGTRVTALPMAAALTLAVVAVAPAGRRAPSLAWWTVPALAAGGFWYLRNLAVAGNPIPEIERLGPISLPHPERLQEGRPDFTIAHYLTDTAVWREYFAPGLHQAFGDLWPLVLAAAAGAALWALLRGGDRMLRWAGAVALLGMLAHVFTPLSAAGAEGAPVAFGINIRYVVPALLAGLVLLPLPGPFARPGPRWALLAALAAALLVTDRPDLAARDEARAFAAPFALLTVVVPALLWSARRRGAPTAAALAGAAGLLALVVALGYPLQRHYLEHRFANRVAQRSVPGMGLDAAYRWARGVRGARIGLVGTTAGFAGYGFYGTDLSNDVVYLGKEGPHGAFNAIPDCARFRAAVNRARLDYLVTAPFLNFIHPDDPIPSPEARWLRGERAVAPLVREGPVTVWRVRGPLDPAGCGPANAPLREVPKTPAR